MFLLRKFGATANILRVVLRNSTSGAGLTGLSSATSGLIISTLCDNEAAATAYSVAGSTIESITTLGTFAAPTATKCRFKEVDATNHPGLYELQLADARFAVSGAKALRVAISGAANLISRDFVVQLTAVDPDSASAFLTAINGEAPPANWHLDSIDSSGRRDVIKIAGTTQTARDLGGTLGAAGAGLTALGDSRLAHLDADISSRNATTPPTAAANATAVRTELATELGRVDVAISTRNATPPPTAANNASAVRTELAVELARVDAAISSRAAPAAAMTLTTGERTAIANEVEAQIIDDTDSEKVLQAIVDKIAAANPSLDDLTLGGIASAVRSELATELARLDAAISSRMASFSYSAPPSAAQNASAVRTELATELARLDLAISTRLASASYAAPDNANIAVLIARITSSRATLLDNLSNLDAAISSIQPGALSEEQAAQLAAAAKVGPLIEGAAFTAPALAAAPTGGSGSGTFALRVTTVPNARVSLVGTGLAATAGTDSVVQFNVDAGDYTVRVAPPVAYAVPSDTPVTVAADDDLTIGLEALSWPEPSTSEMCVCRRYVKAGSAVRSGIVHKFQLQGHGTGAGESQMETRTATSDESGLIEIELLRGRTYKEFHDRALGLAIEYTVAEATTMWLPDMRDGA